MKILVTGAAGLLGSRFVDWILENKPTAQIVGLDDLSGGYVENTPKNHPRYTFVMMDAADSRVGELFEKNSFDYVVHFAAYAAECVSPFIRKFNYNNNLIATANLINFSIKYGIKRFLFTSSMAVYGGNNNPPFSEDLVPYPNDPYGIAKYACEMDLRVAGEQHGLDWVILRPHNVYGQKQNLWDSYRNVIGIWMWKHMNGLPLSIYGDGEQKRAFSYINDSLEPMWTALVDLKTSKQIINIGGIHEYSINETAKTLVEVMGGGEIKYFPPRHEVKYAWSTWDKSVDLLGFAHKTSLFDGMMDMWLWAQAQPHRSRFIWSEYEIETGSNLYGCIFYRIICHKFFDLHHKKMVRY